MGLGVDYHLCTRWDDFEEALERVVRKPDAAVRHGMTDRPRLVRAVDRDRAALRPAGEDRRERGDAERARPVRAARVGGHEALIDVVPADRRRGRRRSDGDRRLEHSLSGAKQLEVAA
jgi:hypothetical protein